MNPLFKLRFVALSALLGLLAACTSRPDPRTLRVQLGAEPVSLDPALAEDGISLRVLGNVMDGLMGYDGKGDLQKRIAQSYRISPDGKRYVFTLRPDARWSDGKPVRPEDFVASFRRALAPETPAKLAPLLFPILNARAFHEGKLPAEKLGVRAMPGQLEIELETPASYFLDAMTLTMTLPVRQDILDAHAGNWPEVAPGTGPYHLTSHPLEQKIVLEKNPAYYEPVPIERVELVYVPDESTGLNLFEEHKLDVLTKIPYVDIARLTKTGVVRTDPFYATYFLAFNLKKPPFDQRDWRRAVAGTIKKDELVSTLASGELPATSWVPKGIVGFYPFDPSNAAFRPAIDAIKKSEGTSKSAFAPAPVAAAFDAGSRNSMIMEKVQADVLKGLGLRLELSSMDWKSYIKMIQTEAPPIYRFGWLAPFRDPIQHLRVFTTGDPNNYSHFSHPDYDRLVEEISAMPASPAREAKVIRAEKILTEDEAVVVPLYHYVQNHAVNPRAQSFRANPFGVIRFDELRLEAH